MLLKAHDFGCSKIISSRHSITILSWRTASFPTPANATLLIFSPEPKGSSVEDCKNKNKKLGPHHQISPQIFPTLTWQPSHVIWWTTSALSFQSSPSPTPRLPSSVPAHKKELLIWKDRYYSLESRANSFNFFLFFKKYLFIYFFSRYISSVSLFFLYWLCSFLCNANFYSCSPIPLLVFISSL